MNPGSIQQTGTETARSSGPVQFEGIRLTSAQRWISLTEFILGSAVVIGHNVYHVIPNEVPILFVVGLISLRLRDGGWGAMGLRWPDSWRADRPDRAHGCCRKTGAGCGRD